MNTKPHETIPEEPDIVTAYERIDEQEAIYKAMTRRAELCYMAGKISAVSAIIGAGELMRTSELEKQYIGGRLLTGMAAIGVAYLGNIMGQSQADERIQAADVPAGEAAAISQKLGIDLPQWAIRGIRNAAAVDEANRQTWIRSKG